MSFTPCRSLIVTGTAFFIFARALPGAPPPPPTPGAVAPPPAAARVAGPELKADGKNPLEPRVRFLEARVADDPENYVAWNQLGDCRLTLLRETGRMGHLAKARAAADASVKAFDDARLNAGGLGLRIRVELAEHHFAAARASALVLREVPRDRDFACQMLFDAELELGQLDDAAKTLAEIQKAAPKNLETHAREMRLAWQRGKIPEAVQAADATVAAVNEVHGPATLAWAHVQRGELAFRLGDFAGAEKHYAAALEAVPANWSAREHVAELRAAEGKSPEALAGLTQVIEETGRPELMQAAGDIEKAAKHTVQAASWHARALSAMKTSADRGEALYTHHLAGLYADSLDRPEEAVAWARKDVVERQTSHSLDALAWALNLTGKYAEAAEAAQKALATGIRDPHILYRAGLIFTSAGQLPAAREALRAAAEINPRQQSFHFHR